MRTCPICGNVAHIEADVKRGTLYLRLSCPVGGCFSVSVVLKPEQVIKQWYEFREVWGEE